MAYTGGCLGGGAWHMRSEFARLVGIRLGVARGTHGV